MTTITTERTVCPAELRATPPLRPERPDGGAIDGDPATLDWIGRSLRWGEDLYARLIDAAKQCPAS